MKRSLFWGLKFYNRQILLLIVMRAPALMPFCDITDLMTRQVTNEAFAIWTLIDLAEHGHIVDQQLFYDELCQSTLKLCKEVQQVKDSGYRLADSQMACLGELFGYLHTRFKALPEMVDQDQRRIHAIDVILYYTDYFLKNNPSINPNGEATHPSL